MLSDEIIKKSYILKDFTDKDVSLNIFGKLFTSIYDLSENYVHYYPRNLILQLVSGCNLRCKHCFFAENEIKYDTSNDLTNFEIFEQIRYFVEEVNILNCTITGGEIFTSSILFKVIEYIKQHNISLKLITNGSLITKNDAIRLGILLNSKFDTIQISLDGAKKETNDKIRGEGVFVKVCENIKQLVENNCKVEIGFTVNSQNVHEITDMYLLAKNLGVSKINFGRFSQYYNSQEYLNLNLKDLFINIAKLSDIYDDSVKINLACLTITDFLDYQIGRELLDDKLANSTKIITNLKCKPRDEQVTLFANGDISLCYDCTIKDLTIGNIKQTPFEKIWREKYKSPIFAKREVKDHACAKCKYINICRVGCPYRAIIDKGSITMPGYNCNYFQQMKGEK